MILAAARGVDASLCGFADPQGDFFVDGTATCASDRLSGRLCAQVALLGMLRMPRTARSRTRSRSLRPASPLRLRSDLRAGLGCGRALATLALGAKKGVSIIMDSGRPGTRRLLEIIPALFGWLVAMCLVPCTPDQAATACTFVVCAMIAAAIVDWFMYDRKERR